VEFVPITPPRANNSDALFANELCNLDVLIPRFGRAIACLLTGTKIKGKCKKVGDCPQTGTQKGKSVRCKYKKSGGTWKASSAA
jgi:hypothetical protein